MFQQIAQLQEEMDREVKNLHDLRDRENATADVKQNAKLREEMVLSCLHSVVLYIYTATHNPRLLYRKN